MVERLPWAKIEAVSEIKPWPGYLNLPDRALAVLAKPGSRILYRQGFSRRMRLSVLCGVSPDSYANGSRDSFRFVIRQLNARGAVLAEWTRVLQPGMNGEQRSWQTVGLDLKPSPDCALEFAYFGGDKESAGVGAFAQAILMPVN